MLKTVKKAKAGPTDRPTNRPTDEVTYRVALHATKKGKKCNPQKNTLLPTKWIFASLRSTKRMKRNKKKWGKREERNTLERSLDRSSRGSTYHFTLI